MNIETETIAGYPILQINKTPLVGWGRIAKRFLDLTLSVVALTVAVPLSIIISIAILADSPGPVFVRLTRIGRGGRAFTLYKFRSMVRDAHKLKEHVIQYNERSDGPLFKMKNDPRITRVGRFLRRLSLDELPQLWNVIVGDMSLVGPRPHEPEEVMNYRAEHRSLMSIKPGITGLAQVSGRSNLLFEDEARIDSYYIENWSLQFDLRILARTFVAVLRTNDAA